MNKTIFNMALSLVAVYGASACNSSNRPEITAIDTSMSNAMARPAVGLELQDMHVKKRAPGSLWQSGSNQFFKDNRAKNVGDIITVIINENAKAEVEANTKSNRVQDSTSGISNLLNLEGKLTNRGIAPGVSSLLDIDSNRKFDGKAETDREDKLTGRIAAVVTQVLPNGYLAIEGHREVMVNYDLQEMRIQGLIRPNDISATNTIPSEKIAQARISYTGRGVVDENQTQQYGAKFLDKWLPF